MSDFKSIPGGICAPKGFSAAGVHCGIRHNHSKLDLALIKADVRCAGAGCYTTNKVYGAPITVDREHLKDGYAQAILVNSGNANTCAANGVALAEECCALVGEALNIPAEDVLPASTGVIGQPMVIDPFARGIPAAAAKLAATAQGSTDAATAIMTTDTHKKEYAIQFELGGKTCTVGAIGKGSGMIAPNMATMLAFYTTDAAVSPVLLEKALKTVVPGTYNQMSVDLDTSTNDTLIIMASGLAGNPEICEENADYDAFVAALTAIAEHMCAEHAGDGEGATHLITCEVTRAPDLKTARAVSRSVVCSNLFKAAVFGRDANWGRILCAIGYTPGDFSIDKVCVWLSSAAGEVYVCENAAYHPYSEDEAAKVLAEHDILVKVDMGTGDASAKAWGCDLTYDYVKINGDYRPSQSPTVTALPKGEPRMLTARSNGEYMKNEEMALLFSEATPYIQKYHGKTMVIKYGGNAMINETLKNAVMNDLVTLTLLGVRVVLVHGGGPAINEMLKKVGVESHFNNGLRVTDDATMEIVQQVLAGKVNKDLVAKLRGRGVGLCGMDGQMLRCTELDPALGHVGEIIHVDPTLISTLLDGGYIPVIATVGMDDLGQAYNVNADTAAAQIAIALKAEKLVSMTDIAGLLRDKDDETTLIPEVEVSEIEGYKAAGIIAGGMIPKIGGMADAIYQGVHEAVIIDGRVPHSILLELFSNRGSGTRFYRRSHQE